MEQKTKVTGIVSARIDIRDYAVLVAKFEERGYKARNTSEFIKDVLHKMSIDLMNSDNDFQKALRESYTHSKEYLVGKGLRFSQDRGTHRTQVEMIELDEYTEDIQPYNVIEQMTGKVVSDEDKEAIERRARELKEMLKGETE